MKNYFVPLIAAALIISAVVIRQKAQVQNTSPQPVDKTGATMADAAGTKTNHRRVPRSSSPKSLPDTATGGYDTPGRDRSARGSSWCPDIRPWAVWTSCLSATYEVIYGNQTIQGEGGHAVVLGSDFHQSADQSDRRGDNPAAQRIARRHRGGPEAHSCCLQERRSGLLYGALRHRQRYCRQVRAGFTRGMTCWFVSRAC